MAGDWIKMRVDLADDPAVIAVAAAVGLDEDAVVGKLHRLWSWADRQTTDGRAGGITPGWIDRFLRRDGLSEALVAAGWLVFHKHGIELPRFDRHNGKTAKRRAMQSLARSVSRSRSVSPSDGDKLATPRRQNGDQRREEKRRSSSPPTPPSLGVALEVGREPPAVHTRAPQAAPEPDPEGGGAEAGLSEPEDLEALWRHMEALCREGGHATDPPALVACLRRRYRHPAEAGYEWWRPPDVSAEERRRKRLRALLRGFSGTRLADGSQIGEAGLWVGPSEVRQWTEFASAELERLLKTVVRDLDEAKRKRRCGGVV